MFRARVSKGVPILLHNALDRTFCLIKFYYRRISTQAQAFVLPCIKAHRPDSGDVTRDSYDGH